EKPSFEISRFKNRLCFIPTDDEGFSLRGNKQRLVYKGRRRSHRFTILGDTSFEYDCILNKEPDSNVITFIMEGAEYFDFFRQPDFVPDPFLKGSYAVYKKETLLGEGTGKLCHIHRPEIIDARRRRCWGDLSIIGNLLCITIPEQWLSEAAYPIIVDPIVGTTTIGSQNMWQPDPPEPPVPLMFELAIPVNRFLISEKMDGECTAYFYTNEDDWEAGGRPVYYTEWAGYPNSRGSRNEGLVDLRVTGNKPRGWRSAKFNTEGPYPSGHHIWFGLFCEYMWLPRFDFGAQCYCDWWWPEHKGIPDDYQNFGGWLENFKLSMYFEYTSSQNYVRTLTQGVRLSDTRRLTQSFLRRLTHGIRINDTRKQAGNYKRSAIQTVQANATPKGIRLFLSKIHDAVHGIDKIAFPVFYRRSFHEKLTAAENLRNLRSFLCVLIDKVKIRSEEKNGWIIPHRLTETVQAADRASRGLMLLVRIITGVFIRDYILSRFLKARSELVLKSCVTREILLDSKI
ncbi:MAG: hypothetical protein LBE79_02665, partial [Tannerella sp.]|nr:hypothetical protein [Tannerella sp.]